jgi:mRNA-degrading endonuclease RelE of RelBE toxin-antitoxin system
MDYEVFVQERALHELEALEPDVCDRIRTKVLEMVSNEWRDLADYDVERLTGVNPTIYRARVGDHRVGVYLDEPQVVIVGVEPRRTAYGDLGTWADRAREWLS